MTNPLELLKESVDTIAPLPPEDWKLFSEIWEPFTARRKTILTVAGEREKFLYFVLEGVQRLYYFDEQGREATLVFTYLPSFGGVLDSIMLGTGSRYYYETLTVSRFLRASVEDLNRLISSKPNVERLIRLGLSHSMAGVLQRLVELQCFSSEERFTQLFKRSPHVLQLVPHKYLANYLGIDATNFSKLLNRVKI
jgi:CRP-like cAMP-binding protein